jgi:hypothetical protein
MTKEQIIKNFIQGHEKGKTPNGSLFTEGRVLYSYNYHFPLCLRLEDGHFIFNKDKYSKTTSSQQSLLKRFMPCNLVKEVTTQEFKQILAIYPQVESLNDIILNKIEVLQ